MQKKIRIILLWVAIAFFAIFFRVWHLAHVHPEVHWQNAQKPKTRILSIPAERGAIYDRFGIPLAREKLAYQVAIYYNQFSSIASVDWEEKEGKRYKIFPKKEYIRSLATMVGSFLGKDPERLVDEIFSTASLFPHTPYILAENLTEQQYAYLKAREKDFVGLSAQIVSKRDYPQGKVACHLLGFLGKISQPRFRAILQETHMLEKALQEHLEEGEPLYLPPGYRSIEEMQARLFSLKERAYSMQDFVGLHGVEGFFEEDLRGFRGKTRIEIDHKGQVVRELPGGKEAIRGKDLTLTISVELQKFAEELLRDNEKTREGKSFGVDPIDGKRKRQKQPWIKGGSIVAIEPHTGEILALASYPRFDPNDFVEKSPSQRGKWLETRSFQGKLWEGKESLSRETPEGLTQIQSIDWEFFLSQIAPKEHPLRTFLEKVGSVGTAVALQEAFASLLYFGQKHSPLEIAKSLLDTTSSLRQHLLLTDRLSLLLLEKYLSPISSAPDRLFALDLLSLFAFAPSFSDALLSEIHAMPLSSFYTLTRENLPWIEKEKQRAQDIFRRTLFTTWRLSFEKGFLAQKRKEEKAKKTYAKPYLEYLEEEEKRQFALYWEEKGLEILLERSPPLPNLPPHLQKELLASFRPFSALDVPLLHAPKKTLQDLALSFYPQEGFGFSRSFAFQTSAPLGSIFKLVTAYEGLQQGAHLHLTDQFEPGKNPIVAYSPKREPYHRIYKKGRLPKSSNPQIGPIDIVGAIEHSSNPFFSILAGDYLQNPEDLNHAAALFGLGEKSGLSLFGETKGNLPSDLDTNITGLYSYAIGQHTLLATPIQTALLLSAIANGKELLQPQLLLKKEGPSLQENPLLSVPTSWKKELFALHIPFPLFTALEKRSSHPREELLPPETKHPIPFSKEVREKLLAGMDKSSWSGKGNARTSRIAALAGNPEQLQQFLSLEHEFIGKTSTAEIGVRPYPYPSCPAQLYKHIWFGALCFDGAQGRSQATLWQSPELVVVVFCRYGASGKETAPLAASLLHKWRAIRARSPATPTHL